MQEGLQMAILCISVQQAVQARQGRKEGMAVVLHFIQCPFPNQIQFGLEKLHPKIAYNFPNQFQFGLERKK